MLSALFLLLAQPASATVRPIVGIAVAGDGDSLSIGDTRIRLFGIDAPEFDQVCTRPSGRWMCGKESARQLASLVTGREAVCMPAGQDRFGRTLARCSVGGLDVNRAMIEKGFAVAFRRYSTDYVAAEEGARSAKLGVWAGAFQMPAEVRKQSVNSGRREPSLRQAARPPSHTGCLIKGNHSRRGEWIYHLPGMPYYQQTQAEAIFCNEPEAQRAGYRRARLR